MSPSFCVVVEKCSSNVSSLHKCSAPELWLKNECNQLDKQTLVHLIIVPSCQFKVGRPMDLEPWSLSVSFLTTPLGRISLGILPNVQNTLPMCCQIKKEIRIRIYVAEFKAPPLYCQILIWQHKDLCWRFGDRVSL